MQIAVLTLEGYNELDSFIAAAILNRMRAKGWSAYITSPSEEVTSMNGVVVRRQRPLDFVEEADAVLIGSGIRTRDHAGDADLLARLRLDPARQLIGAQCSGTLLLAKLGLIGDLPACTDLTTKPWVIEAGVEVIDAPFVAHGNIATAGGCLSSQYLAAWMIARLGSLRDAEEAIHYVAPVGEKTAYVARALDVCDAGAGGIGSGETGRIALERSATPAGTRVAQERAVDSRQDSPTSPQDLRPREATVVVRGAAN